MPTLSIETWVDAPIERCFDLARSIDFHITTVWTASRPLRALTMAVGRPAPRAALEGRTGRFDENADGASLNPRSGRLHGHPGFPTDNRGDSI